MFYYEIRTKNLPDNPIPSSNFKVDAKSNTLLICGEKEGLPIRDVYSITRVFESPKIYNTVEKLKETPGCSLRKK